MIEVSDAPKAQNEANQVDSQLPKKATWKSRWKLCLGAAIAIGLVLTIVGIVVEENVASKARAAEAARVAAEEAEAARLRLLPDAADACFAASDGGVEIGDEGRSLTLQTRGNESFSGTSFITVACILRELEIPDSVMNRMGNTRALDGRQDAEWADYAASWSYHPDSGMNVIVELVD
ncbi:hypothetical protein ACFQ36_01190 [Arthrobacter sp. GCM10027362]|uniref:hypothetical protein n=1 Tax=Arthrobacter sp. GCM10027362 TaxID=3273379 RepID=UPI00362A7728